MSGGPPSTGRRPPRRPGSTPEGHPAAGRAGIQVDLVGVRREAAATLDPGDLLDVFSLPGGATVCLTQAGEVVGALVAFPGLSRMVERLREGHAYVARVEETSQTHCRVTLMEG